MNGILQRLLGRRGDAATAVAAVVPPAPPAESGVKFGANGGNGSSSNGGGNSYYYRDTSYAGASRIRKQLHNWIPARATADADLLPDMDMLVARSRDLNRNNGVAAGAFQSLQDNAVGVGLRLNCAPDYVALGKDIKWRQEWSRVVESLWRTWADSVACDAAGQQTFNSLTQLVFRSSLENGEALCLPLWMDRPETPFKTCLQLVESDRMSNPQFVPASLYLRGGIETDVYGKPIAYHIQKQMNWPGYYYGIYGIQGYGISSGLEWERIPAVTPFGRRRFLHVHVKERVDQTRGKPILAPVIEQFRMLDSYQRTELQSAIVNSLVAGILETPMDPAGIAEMMGGDPTGYLNAKNEYRVQLEGGTIVPLYPGDKMTPFTPSRPSLQYAAFVESVLRQIGSSMGLPYELVLKDFSKTNYSSARAALNEAWRFFINRRTWLSTYWCAPVYRLWLEEAINAGMVEAPGYYDNPELYLRAKWIGPGRGQIDPTKEAEAAQIRMDTFTSTLEDECAEQGRDWEDVLEQRALEVARMKELDLESPLTPRPPKGETLAPDIAEESAPAAPAPSKEAA
jgi:lambda family phage portal protein